MKLFGLQTTLLLSCVKPLLFLNIQSELCQHNMELLEVQHSENDSKKCFKQIHGVNCCNYIPYSAMSRDYSARVNKINIRMLFSFHTNNPEIKSKQRFPHSDENCSMHAMLSWLREGFSKHGISAATLSEAHGTYNTRNQARSKGCSTWTLDRKI